MRNIKVKVHKSSAKLKKENQLAWKIAEIAFDNAPLNENAVDIVINRIIDNASVAIAALQRQPVISAREMALAHPREKSAAVNLVCNLTGDNSRDVVSFGTEAGLFQEIGISTVVCGPGSIEQAHKIDEHVSFEQLKLCLKMLIDLKEHITN